MNEKRPILITLYGDILFLGGILSIIDLIFPSLFNRLGFFEISSEFFSKDLIQLLLSVIMIVLAYGFLKLKIWGYWSIVIYFLFFIVWGIISLIQNKNLSQNFISSFIALVFIIPTRKHFIKNRSSS